MSEKAKPKPNPTRDAATPVKALITPEPSSDEERNPTTPPPTIANNGMLASSSGGTSIAVSATNSLSQGDTLVREVQSRLLYHRPTGSHAAVWIHGTPSPAFVQSSAGPSPIMPVSGNTRINYWFSMVHSVTASPRHGAGTTTGHLASSAPRETSRTQFYATFRSRELSLRSFDFRASARLQVWHPLYSPTQPHAACVSRSRPE